MKVFTISLAFAGTALADPSTPQPFDVMALRSASPIHFASLSASQGSLFLNLPQQGATCNGSNNRATFYLQGSDLFLYSESGNAQQQIFVDRSGLGQGQIGYTTVGSPRPPYSELEGWSINSDGNLVFQDKIPQACPNAVDGAWSVWLSEVVDPAGHKECLGFSPLTLPNDNPVSCVYS